MERIDLSAFTLSQLHTTDTILLLCERAGADVRIERQMIGTWVEEDRKAKRRNKFIGPQEQHPPKKKSPEPKEAVWQSGIVCPEDDCGGGYLQIKQREGVTYTVCPTCTKSARFK